MDLLNFAPSGAREEWWLAAIGLLSAIVLALIVRIGSPRAPRARFGLALVFLGFYALAFLCRQLAPSPSLKAGLGSMAMIFLAFALARLMFLLGFDVVLARSRSTPVPKIVRDIAQAMIFLLAVGLSLHAAGVEPGQLLTTSAVLTVGAGLALQETLGNLLAGLALQAETPFAVGDWIEVHEKPGAPGVIGKVREINWRAARLHTLDNVDVVVPNALLAKVAITNYDRPHAAARRSVYFSTTVKTPPRAVHDAVLAAVREVPGVLADPPPSLVTNSFNESGVGYWLRYFITEMGRRDAIDGGVRDRVWYALGRIGVELGVPSRTLQVHEVTEKSEELEKGRRLEERVAAIKQVTIIPQLDETQRMRLASRTRIALFAPGEAVIRQGEVGDSMFVVQRGQLSVLIAGTEGPPSEVAKLEPGQFFGEMSLLTGAPRRATVITSTAAELLVIDRVSFRELLDGHPDFARQISEKVVERELGLERQASGAEAAHAEVTARSVDLLGKIRHFFGLGQS